MYEVLVNRLGGLSLPRKSVVRLTDRPDMTLDVYRGRKTTTQQQHSTDHESDRTENACTIMYTISFLILKIFFSKHVKERLFPFDIVVVWINENRKYMYIKEAGKIKSVNYPCL